MLPGPDSKQPNFASLTMNLAFTEIKLDLVFQNSVLFTRLKQNAGKVSVHCLRNCSSSLPNLNISGVFRVSPYRFNTNQSVNRVFLRHAVGTFFLSRKLGYKRNRMFLTIRARISKGGDVDKNLRRGRIPTNLNRKCSRDVSLKKIFAERVFQALGDYFNRYFGYESDEVKQSKRKKVKTIYGNRKSK